MDVLKLIFQPVLGFLALLSRYSGTFYGLFALIMTAMFLINTLNFGPGGFIATAPMALLALILRKLNQIEKGRN